jgi:hypothetical protein
VINRKAYKNYLQSKNIDEHRFCDDNMNRICNKPFDKNSYEHRRFKKLTPIFDEIDVALDIHSVSKGNDII